MRNSKTLLCLLVLPLATYAAYCGLDSISPTAFQVGVTANLTVKATADSRSGTWQVKLTSVPAGWTINNGAWPIPGDTVNLHLNPYQQGSFVFKATPGVSAVNGDVAFELWYDRGPFGGGWQKVDGPRSWRLTRWSEFQVKVTSSEKGARVYVDGVDKGVTGQLLELAPPYSLTVSVPEGRHTFEVRKDRFENGGPSTRDITGNTTIPFVQRGITAVVVDNASVERGQEVVLKGDLNGPTLSRGVGVNNETDNRPVKFYVDDVLRGSATTFFELPGLGARGHGAVDFRLPGSVTAGLSAGEHVIKAVFEGDLDYLPAQGTGKLTVRAPQQRVFAKTAHSWYLDGITIKKGSSLLGRTGWDLGDLLSGPHLKLPADIQPGDVLIAEAPNIGSGSATVSTSRDITIILTRSSGPTVTPPTSRRMQLCQSSWMLHLPTSPCWYGVKPPTFPVSAPVCCSIGSLPKALRRAPMRPFPCRTCHLPRSIM